MASPHQPTLRNPTQGRTVAVVGDVYRFLATGEDTDGKYALLEAIVPPGGSPPPHVHSREDEASFYSRCWKGPRSESAESPPGASRADQGRDSQGGTGTMILQ